MEFKIGGIARVIEELEREKAMTQVKYFYLHETFVIKDIVEEDGVTYLQGGHFDFFIPVDRCEVAEKNDNPVPYCRYDLPVVIAAGKIIDMKMLAIHGDLARNPHNSLLAYEFMKTYVAPEPINA